MKKFRYSTQKELDGLMWASRVIDFGLALTNAAALNELTTAYVMLRDRKDIYRHMVKRLANETMKQASLKQTEMRSVMKSKLFFDTYSDKVIDLAEDDITLFRISIKQTLDDFDFPDSEIVSYIETARSMLELASAQFKSIMNTARIDYKYDYTTTFYEFNLESVLNAWDKVCFHLYSNKANIDLNTQRNLALFNKMGESFANGTYVQPCLNEAQKVEPNFQNEIIVKS